MTLLLYEEVETQQVVCDMFMTRVVQNKIYFHIFLLGANFSLKGENVCMFI